MTTPQFPGRPNLEQLKHQAKDLLRSARAHDPAALARFRTLPALAAVSEAAFATTPLALHDAQSVLAREHGFPSWNALRDRVEELTLEFDGAVAAFTRSSVERRLGRAERVLALFPDLVAKNFHAALVFGDATVVEKHLAATPSLAARRGGPLDWEPLLYVAHSAWAQKNSAGLLAIARRLLALGASPHASHPFQGDATQPLSALYAAACESRHAALAQLLLEAGAHPNDGECVYHAAENGDTAMLDLLAAHGAASDGGAGSARWTNTPLYFILGHRAGSARDAEIRRGAAWLLAHGANPNRVCYPEKSGETPLHAAARNWDGPMIELLLAYGADPRVPRRDGRTALTLALVNGRLSAADALRRAGAVETLSLPEQFLAACFRGDRAEALRLRDPAVIAAHPALLAEAVANLPALETLLACGCDPQATDHLGATPLHWAAFHGNVAAVRLLIAHGAPLDRRDRTYQSLPLGWADYASAEHINPSGDYAGVARVLIEAGAALPTEEQLEKWGSDEVISVVLAAMRTRPRSV